MNTFRQFIGEGWSTSHHGNAFRSFKNDELQQELGHEVNNIAIEIGGKVWKVIPGGKDHSNEMRRAQDIAKKIVNTLQAKGKKASWQITGAEVTK